jgi:guanyl-specific ribonuclease Sa
VGHLGRQPAQTTDRLIRAGGPIPYPKDGMVFGNREWALAGSSRVPGVFTPAINARAFRGSCAERRQEEICLVT